MADTTTSAKIPEKTSTPAASSGGQTTSEAPSRVQLKAAVARAGSYDEQVQMLRPVQQHGEKGGEGRGVHAAAAHGISGSGGSMPHGSQIQQAFGGYDLGNIQAHLGKEATEGSKAMGADAYATGNHIAFAGAPDLHTAAHEAAHTVQQKAGVQLSGGVGQVGDSYEQHADRVADAVVAGKSAEPILAEVGAGGGGGGAEGVQRKETTEGGGATQPLTLDDYSKRATGKGEAELDTAGAAKKEEEYSKTELDDWVKLFEKGLLAKAAGTSVLGNRSEEEMLAAIMANTAPKFLARVGPARNFTWNSFGHPDREFIFATEPADLIGCTPLEAMIKVGWTAVDIRNEATQPIAVAVIDSSKLLPKKDGSGDEAKMTTGKFEWPEITAKARGDQSLIDDWASLVDKELVQKFGVEPTPTQAKSAFVEYLEMSSTLAVGAEPPGALEKELWFGVRMVLDKHYGANPLYSGMGATVDQKGNTGAREVMVSRNGTGYALTGENSRVIPLGAFTAEECDRSFAPAPAPTTGGTP